MGMSLLLFQIYAQDAITSGGGDAFGNNGNISYAIGQLLLTTNAGTGGSVSQGIQQPYEVFTITGFYETWINLDVTTYPNPTTDLLMLKVTENIRNMEYQLYNESGELLLNKEIAGNLTTIPMSGLSSAIYILNVNRNNRQIKTFKIIKK